MEILLVFILISILWGNSKFNSIITSIEDIRSELRHPETNTLLSEIKYALSDSCPDYSYDFTQLRDELKKSNHELNNINDELQWHKPLSFAGKMINVQQTVVAELTGINETLKEMIDVQQEAVVKLDELLAVHSEVN